MSLTCSECHLRRICLPLGLTPTELHRLDQRLVVARHKVRRGGRVFQAGAPFESVYAIWTGCFKSSAATADGREQVTGFHMGGEWLGLEGIGAQHHRVDAVALEDSQVCVIPYHRLQSLTLEVGALQHHVHSIMSREIVRNHGMMVLLGSMCAEERIGAFLLDLMERLKTHGYSASSIVLRMSREEIGSYLGLKLETVSRTLSKLQASGVLSVRHRELQVIDPVGLRQVVDGATA
jgi:CRP/FNR family transcriptional regulator, anaerobic regulatory protein